MEGNTSDAARGRPHAALRVPSRSWKEIPTKGLTRRRRRRSGGERAGDMLWAVTCDAAPCKYTYISVISPWHHLFQAVAVARGLLHQLPSNTFQPVHRAHHRGTSRTPSQIGYNQKTDSNSENSLNVSFCSGFELLSCLQPYRAVCPISQIRLFNAPPQLLILITIEVDALRITSLLSPRPVCSLIAVVLMMWWLPKQIAYGDNEFQPSYLRLPLLLQ